MAIDRAQKGTATQKKLAGWETRCNSFAAKVQSVHEAPGAHGPPRLHGVKRCKDV